MKTIQLQGQLRTDFGKRYAKQVRAQQEVPGVLYGQGLDEVVHFSVAQKAMRPLIYTADFQLVEVVLGEKKYLCVLKDMQFDKVTDELIHFDLLQLSEDKKVTVSIPLKFEGTAAGVLLGGKLVPKMKALRVKTFPKFLQEYIVVNLEKLQLNESIRVEDVKVENFEILNSPRIPIVSVALTRQLKQQDSEEKRKAEAEKK